MGFLVKGVLYMVIGALALQVAAKAGGRVTGMRGALTTVLGQPFGRTLLLVVVAGLLGYAAWRVRSAMCLRLQRRQLAKDDGCFAAARH